MKCPLKHQQAYDKGHTRPAFSDFALWCPSCKRWLTQAESVNMVLRLLRRAAGVETSVEQHLLEKEPPA